MIAIGLSFCIACNKSNSKTPLNETDSDSTDPSTATDDSDSDTESAEPSDQETETQETDREGTETGTQAGESSESEEEVTDTEEGAGTEGEGSSESEEEATDTGEGESGTDTGVPKQHDDWDCPDPITESCKEAADPLPVLLTADELGENVTFAALGARSLLAIQKSETEQTVILLGALPESSYSYTLEGSGLAKLAVDPESQVSAIGVYGDRISDLFPLHIALICIDQVCSLYGAEIEAPDIEETLVPLDNGTPPDLGKINGIWFSNSDGSGIVCAYGKGIACFDSVSWEVTLLSENETPSINDMEEIYPGIVAVGDQGLVVHDGFPSWHGESGTAYPDLLTVVVSDGEYLAAGREGALMNRDHDMHCSITDEDILYFEVEEEWAGPRYTGVTATGRVFTGDGPLPAISNLCFTGLTLDNVVDTTEYACGIAQNHLILTADTLYGTNDCAID